MRMARGGEFRRKLIEVSTKVAMIFFTALFCLWMISGARADENVKITGVTHTENNGVHEVKIQFSNSIAKENVAVDHQRNFIQVSLKGADAFPAQTQNVNDGVIDKLFVYQYEPSLVRARILLNTKSEKFKKTTSWEVNGNELAVRFSGTMVASDQVTTKKAAPIKEDTSAEAEARIEKEILSGKTAAVTPVKNVEDEPLFTAKAATSSIKSEKAATGTQSWARMASALLTVLLLMCGALFGYRKLRGIRSTKGASNGRAMETILSHNLGGKRSLSLVRIADRYYVLGVTDHNISVVTHFDDQTKIEKYIDEITTGGGFESMLSGKLNFFARKDEAEQSWEAETKEAPRATTEKASVRETIKKRIEGFKPLY